jgi:hypothetical protein
MVRTLALGVCASLVVVGGRAEALTVRYTNAATRALTVEQRAAIEKTANAAEAEARRHLPDLTRDLVLIVDVGRNVLAETGETGVASSPTLIRWMLDPQRREGAMAIINAHLRATILHESHHLVREWLASGVEPPMSFWDAVIAEGLATAFARDVTGRTAPWGEYPSDVGAWLAELRGLPDDQFWSRFNQWMGDLPDGRKFVGYKVGTYLVDLALKNSGRTHAELARLPSGAVLALAGQ